jgi:hypothetical protein
MKPPQNGSVENGDQVLRSFHEWMVQQARAANSTNQEAQFSDLNNQASRKGSYFSPTIAFREPSIDRSTSPELRVAPRQQANISPVATIGPSVGNRVFRAAVRGLLIAIVVAVVWLAYRDDQTKKLIEAWRHSSAIWLASALGAGGRVSESAAEPSTKDQVASTPAATSRPAKELVELQQQLQTMMNDLAVLRRDLEQVSSKQEQMSRDIATMRATEQDVSEKMSSLTKAAPVHATSRKNGARAVHAETPRQPAEASVPRQVSPTGTVPPTDQAPRPPLPVPMPDETLSPVH